MKNSVKALLLALSLLVSAVLFAGCNNSENNSEEPQTSAQSSETAGEESQTSAQSREAADNEGSSVWDAAEYKEDTEVGEGAIAVKVEICAEDKSVTLTVHTDKDNLGAALLENNLVSGKESEYGLYIKVVNGIEADFDKDGTYWSISKDGEYLMTGADSTPIADGEHYELTRTKG